MKNAVLFLSALAVSHTDAFAGERILVAVLENPQCKGNAPRVVRPLFLHDDSGWTALDTPQKAASSLSERMKWTALLDGKSLGNILSIDPKVPIEPEWTYPRDFLLQLEPGQLLPEVPNTSESFAGWCESPKYSPLVLISAGASSGPAHWHHARDNVKNKRQLLSAFTKSLDGTPLCLTNKKSDPYRYGQKDLRIVDVLQTQDTRQLVAVSLRKNYTECNSELGDATTPRWFYIDGNIRYLGDDLSFVGAGDYAHDGKSELIFWYSGYNKGGYVLFSDSFGLRVDFTWNYH